MTCDLILDEHGWWLQCVDQKTGRKRCTLMDATNEAEAHLEAQEEGFSEMHVWFDNKQTKTVCIPKRTLGKDEVPANT